MAYNSIGFIGAGNMASAIIKGIIKSGMFKPEQIYASSKNGASSEKLKNELGINATSNKEIVNACDVVVLAVKPGMLTDVIKGFRADVKKETLFISIVAGTSIERLKTMFLNDALNVVRAMPNTPALVGEAMTAICAEDNISDSEKDFVLKLFESFGEAEYVPEKLMDAVTGVSGSSPAYVYMFIEALADGAVAEGMPRAQAYKFAAQAVLGSAKMVLETGEHPGALKDAVCSPGGTTIEAVATLENLGFRSAVIEAERACIEKSRVL
ncbi:MAG: pyrroline-5-carboxylate reductase [Lachnospiraceae bacterium]|nr:pyrroline-5-carboxylate reductase [Lachnospiraceae bacterium]